MAGLIGLPLKDLSFAQSSPEWGNEKGIGTALAFRLLGLNSYHCVEPQTFGSEKVTKFLKENTKELLGGVMVVNTAPVALGNQIVEDFDGKRKNLGWDKE